VIIIGGQFMELGGGDFPTAYLWYCSCLISLSVLELYRVIQEERSLHRC